MAEMKDSGTAWLGMIPKDWELSKISSIYELRTQKVSDKDYPPLSVTMNGIVPQLDSAAKTNAHDDRKLVKKGDFAINSRSDRRGSCGVSEYDGSVSLINTVMKPRDEMNPDYYNWLFHTIQFADEFYKWGHGIVDDLWTTNWQDMKHIDIPVPTLDEQKVIADYLNKAIPEIDALHTDIEKQIETLEEYKKSIITEAVTKGLDPDVEMKDSGIEWIGEINSNFSIGKLGLFSFVTKLAGFEYTDTMCKAINDEGDIPIVRAQNVRMLKNNFDSIKEFIDYETSIKLSRCALDKKCLLMTFIGAGIGDVCVFDKKERYHLAPNVAKIEITDKNKLIDEFVMYYICSYAGIGEINKISKASAQPSLSMETIRGIKIIIPTLKEQTEIVRYLDEKCIEMDDIITNKKEQLETLEQYKKSLIYEYVTGKKEVQ